jgi:ATP/maltotriose-dependent transcriptional regulator MalT
MRAVLDAARTHQQRHHGDDGRRSRGRQRALTTSTSSSPERPTAAPARALPAELQRRATRAEREIVYEDARAVLEEITHARHPVIPFETPEEKRAWIVEHCEGLTQQQAANRAYTSASAPSTPRASPPAASPTSAGETDTVRYDSVAERKRYVRELAQEDMSARSIAKVLSVSYNTVRRDLGRRA